MSGRNTAGDGVSGRSGDRTGTSGTPVAVDVARDRRHRGIWGAFLAGPVIWITHFMVVYLVVEAGCTGDGPGLEVFDPPVPAAVTLAATAVAALACLASARWAWNRWQAGGDEGPAPLALPGFLLALFSFVAVLFVGLPALAFEC